MTTKTQEPPLLHSIKGAAERLGVSRNFVRDFIAKGELPCVRLGRRVFIADTDLRAFVKRHRSRG